jgi:hypothetical protein
VWLWLVTLVCLAAVGGVTHAASPAPSVARDRLASSLLMADDLPGFVGRDLEDPTELDIDRLAFDEHGGSEVAARAWVSQDAGVVFDQRMLLPSSKAALAYLEAAEPTLSEADVAGLALVADDPLTPTTRHWAGEARIGSELVAMDVWLIPVGPVVAKVAATVFGPGLDGRRLVAERALDRIEAAFGPAATSAASDAPNGQPGTSPTADLGSLERRMLAPRSSDAVALMGRGGGVSGPDPGEDPSGSTTGSNRVMPR